MTVPSFESSKDLSLVLILMFSLIIICRRVYKGNINGSVFNHASLNLLVINAVYV